MLITALPKEEAAAVYVPQGTQYVISSQSAEEKRQLEETLQEMISVHNEEMGSILEGYNKVVEDWRKTILREQKMQRRVMPKKEHPMR